MELNLSYPHKLHPLFDPELRKPYVAVYGGRGSGKSETVARYIIMRCLEKKTLVLCARESQNSLADSVHALLSGIINDLELNSFFKTQKNEIIARNGSKIIFKGMRQEAGHLRSMTGIDIAWLEEAQYIGRAGFTSLDDTIRKEGSQIIMVMNPRYADDPIYQDFVAENREDTLKLNINITENRFATKVSRAKAQRMKINDYDNYLHVYCGELKEASDALIFKGMYEVKDFETPDKDIIFYYGADWGFSDDPNTLTRAWIDEEEYNLMIDYAAFGHHTKLKDLPAMWDQVPGVKHHRVRADNARPETIDLMNDKGYNVVPCVKGPGSIEDGIERLKGFNKIIIHTRCVEMQDEARLYSYKIDKRTSEITTTIRDKYNHGWDAVRYSTEGIIHSVSAADLLEFQDIF